MALVRVNGPQTHPVDPDDVYDHLRLVLDGGSPEAPIDADYVSFLIDAATEAFDGPQGFLNRPLIAQDWKLTLDAFPTGAIWLPLAPVISVTQVAYLDADFVERVVDPADYAVFGAGDASGARVRPRPGKSWPQAVAFPESVAIDFRAGYGESASDVPAPVRMAVAQYAAHLYENREPAVVGVSIAPVPLNLRDAVAPFQFWGALG